MFILLWQKVTAGLNVFTNILYFTSFPAPSEYLVVAAETEILSISLDPRIKAAPIEPIRNLIGVVGVDFDYEEDYIYFSQVISKTISRKKIGQSQIEDIIKMGNASSKCFDNIFSAPSVCHFVHPSTCRSCFTFIMTFGTLWREK